MNPITKSDFSVTLWTVCKYMCRTTNRDCQILDWHVMQFVSCPCTRSYYDWCRETATSSNCMNIYSNLQKMEHDSHSSIPIYLNNPGIPVFPLFRSPLQNFVPTRPFFYFFLFRSRAAPWIPRSPVPGARFENSSRTSRRAERPSPLCREMRAEANRIPKAIGMRRVFVKIKTDLEFQIVCRARNGCPLDGYVVQSGVLLCWFFLFVLRRKSWNCYWGERNVWFCESRMSMLEIVGCWNIKKTSCL